MTSRERILAAIQWQMPDRVPVSPPKPPAQAQPMDPATKLVAHPRHSSGFDTDQDRADADEYQLAVLTPYAVELRYDIEFWPERTTGEEALGLAAQVLVSVRGEIECAVLAEKPTHR